LRGFASARESITLSPNDTHYFRSDQNHHFEVVGAG
jgi:hypothetical protein